jgi:hypothetical protein
MFSAIAVLEKSKAAISISHAQPRIDAERLLDADKRPRKSCLVLVI